VAAAAAFSSGAERGSELPRGPRRTAKGMGRTPGPFGSMVSDPTTPSEFVGHERGPLGSFSCFGSVNQWCELLHTHV
jgi:hypothetical protein